jgi:hypothetical protein
MLHGYMCIFPRVSQASVLELLALLAHPALFGRVCGRDLGPCYAILRGLVILTCVLRVFCRALSPPSSQSIVSMRVVGDIC